MVWMERFACAVLLTLCTSPKHLAGVRPFHSTACNSVFLLVLKVSIHQSKRPDVNGKPGVPLEVKSFSGVEDRQRGSQHFVFHHQRGDDQRAKQFK